MVHDLNGLIKLASKEPWSNCLALVLNEHFGPALEAMGMEEPGDLKEIVGEAMLNTLLGCAFEDFLTREFDVEGINIVDDYLKRRGWKESAGIKAYMGALRVSVMSLYEVSNIVPGTSLMARDLLRDGEPVLVHEQTATRMLEEGEHIAARIVSVLGKNRFAGGLLPIDESVSSLVREGFRTDFGQRKSRKTTAPTDDDLRAASAIFTLSWLSDEIRASDSYLSEIENAAKNLFFYRVSFPLAPGVSQKKIAVLLDSLKDTTRQRAKTWSWFEDELDVSDEAEEDESDFFDDGPIRTTIWMEGRHLHFQASSEKLAHEGEKRLRKLLGALVGEPHHTKHDFGQMLADMFSDEPEPNPVLPNKK